ncbi:MAG: phosphatase PAP2 family protein [Saprospiraceae bacterium]
MAASLPLFGLPLLCDISFEGLVSGVGFVLSVGISDFTSSSLIKKSVQRIRPCNDVEMVDRVVTRVSCGGGYSFTSSHASNHFAIAVFLITALGLSGKWQQKALLAWAGSIAFAQCMWGCIILLT